LTDGDYLVHLFCGLDREVLLGDMETNPVRINPTIQPGVPSINAR